MPPECFLQFSIQQLKVFLKIEFREIFFHKTPNYTLSGSVIIKTLPDCSKSSWLPIWSRPRLFSVYHLLIIFDHSYLSAIVRFHKIKINLYPACQYPPTLKLSKSSYSHLNYICTIMQYMFQFILFQTKEQISWLLLLQKNYKELFYFDIWPVSLYMDVLKSSSGISRLQKKYLQI